MYEKRSAVLGLWMVLSASAVGATEPAAETPPGKAIFLASQCQACHGVSAQGIKVDDAGAEPADKDDPQPPDLSDVGSKVKADFIDRYLLKKETIEGRKHKKSFKGSDADRQALVAWLASLQAKTDKPAEKKTR